MKRRAWLQASLGLGCLVNLPSFSASRLSWQTCTFNGLGTTLSIRAAHQDAERLTAALQAAREVMAHIEDQMSLFRSASAINQLNRKGALIGPDPSLVRLLRMSRDISEKSHGAFDVTVQPLWALYAEMQKKGRLPTTDEIASARQRIGWQHMQINAKRITLTKPGMGVTLNGIAQGYASDLVRKQLQGFGIAHALINTGEWSSLGQADHERDWTLGIADAHHAGNLFARLRMKDWCVATSADDQCKFSEDRKHHHILDPATGYSPRDISSVTIAAQSCTLADALTKVLFVAGYERALRLASTWHVEALIVHKNGEWKASPAISRQLIL